MRRTSVCILLIAIGAGCTNDCITSDERSIVEGCRDVCRADFEQGCAWGTIGSPEYCAGSCQMETDEAEWASCTLEWDAWVDCAGATADCELRVTACDLEAAALRSCLREYCATPNRCDADGEPLPPTE